MQETKTPDTNFIASHQLMKNISLRNFSDAGTIHHNNTGVDDLRLRRFSVESFPVYNNQLNYSSYEQTRKPLMELRYNVK